MGLKALVVDDSVIFQKIISEVLRGIPGVGEVSVAGTGTEGLAMVGSVKPDVVFLDLHLPDMDGMEVLVHIKNRYAGTRVVIVSGLSSEGAALTVKALSRGAQQFISKPSGAGFQESVTKLTSELEPVIKTVTLQMNLDNRVNTPQPLIRPRVAPTPQPAAPAPARGRQSYWVVGLAVSTGGPEALTHVIPRLPANFPLPVVMVQHMPPLFTQSLAQSLDKKSQVPVTEAQAGDVLQPGHVYIAPGGKHMVIREVGGRPVVALNEDPPEQSVRPAADVLFRSLSTYPGGNSVLSVVMTGMGEDGLAGLKLLNASGTYCLTQTEDTCVVYGMPRAVDNAGLSNEKVPLNKIAERMTTLASTSCAAIRV